MDEFKEPKRHFFIKKQLDYNVDPICRRPQRVDNRAKEDLFSFVKRQNQKITEGYVLGNRKFKCFKCDYKSDSMGNLDTHTGLHLITDRRYNTICKHPIYKSTTIKCKKFPLPHPDKNGKYACPWCTCSYASGRQYKCLKCLAIPSNREGIYRCPVCKNSICPPAQSNCPHCRCLDCSHTSHRKFIKKTATPLKCPHCLRIAKNLPPINCPHCVCDMSTDKYLNYYPECVHNATLFTGLSVHPDVKGFEDNIKNRFHFA